MIYKFKEFKDEPLLINHLNMGGKNPKGEEINVTSRYFTRNGKPWIGVMGAVSYTHLRAHETDSYLVCRLLLEKKKKRKK